MTAYFKYGCPAPVRPAMKSGARMLRIAFDSHPIGLAVVAERLKEVSPFVTVKPAPPGTGYRWVLSLGLHPITQDGPASEIVDRVCVLLGIPRTPLIRITWEDSK